MLVVSRKLNESVIIDGKIEIIISEISGDKVQLAIHAPREMTILRKELFETICVNQEANQPVSPLSLQHLVEVVQKQKCLKDELQK